MSIESIGQPTDADLQNMENMIKLQIEQQFDAGKTMEEISSGFGISKSDVYHILCPPDQPARLEKPEVPPVAQKRRPRPSLKGKPCPKQKPRKPDHKVNKKDGQGRKPKQKAKPLAKQANKQQAKDPFKRLKQVVEQEWNGTCQAWGYIDDPKRFNKPKVYNLRQAFVTPYFFGQGRKAKRAAKTEKKVKQDPKATKSDNSFQSFSKTKFCFIHKPGFQLPVIFKKEVKDLGLNEEKDKAAKYKVDYDLLKKFRYDCKPLEFVFRNGVALIGTPIGYTKYEVFLKVNIDDDKGQAPSGKPGYTKVIAFIHGLYQINIIDEVKEDKVNVKTDTSKPSDSINNPLDPDPKILPVAPTPAEPEQVRKEAEPSPSLRIQDLSPEEFKRKRMEKKMSQKALALALGLSAGSASNIGDIENGRAKISPKHYKKLEELLL